MSDLLKNIFENPVMLSREGQYVAIEGLKRKMAATDILEQLPFTDQFRLYDYVTTLNDPELAQLPPDSYHNLVSSVGQALDMASPDALAAATTAILGRPEIRQRQEVPEDKKNSSDGFQTSFERSRQLYLAYLLTSFLAPVLKIPVSRFIKSRLDIAEQAKALALLAVNRAEKDSTVQEALKAVANVVTLTPETWQKFKETVVAASNENSSSLFDMATAMTDDLVVGTITDLGAEEIAAFDSEQSYQIVRALGWGGTATSSIAAAQLRLYKNLGIPAEYSALRERQIDDALRYFSSLGPDKIQYWLKTKASWHTLPYEEKVAVLSGYTSTLCRIFGTPLTPDVTTVSKDKAPASTDAYYLAFDTVADGDIKKLVWNNGIYFVEGTSSDGKPLSISSSMRSALSTDAHETIHSDDRQIKLRRSGVDDTSKIYMAAFQGCPAPETIRISDPLYDTASIFYWTEAGRLSYVSHTADYERYRQQPREKYAWAYQNQFAAVLNGTLVTQQQETGERDLKNDLESLFKKAAKVLAAREELTGRQKDIVPLKKYDFDEYPFGALSLKGDEAIKPGIQAEAHQYVTADLSGFDSRLAALDYMQTALQKLNTDKRTKPADYLPLYRQAADFLIQLPDEIWSIKKKLGDGEPALAVKLDALSLEAQQLGEDLNDYHFVVTRWKKIEREAAATARTQRARRSAAKKLAAAL